jgi:hypothetical protein
MEENFKKSFHSSTQEWQQISQDFYNSCNFPNCIGALDGKHINIQAPANNRSLFFNYKKTYSIVLRASCDARYTFVGRRLRKMHTSIYKWFQFVYNGS